MNQMERIAKLIVSEPNKEKRQRMKNEIDRIMYLSENYGKEPRTQLSKKLGIPKYQLNQIIIENEINVKKKKVKQKPAKSKLPKTGKSAQNRRAYLKRMESVK